MTLSRNNTGAAAVIIMDYINYIHWPRLFCAVQLCNKSNWVNSSTVNIGLTKYRTGSSSLPLELWWELSCQLSDKYSNRFSSFAHLNVADIVYSVEVGMGTMGWGEVQECIRNDSIENHTIVTQSCNLMSSLPPSYTQNSILQLFNVFREMSLTLTLMNTTITGAVTAPITSRTPLPGNVIILWSHVSTAVTSAGALPGKTWTVLADQDDGYNVTLPLGFGKYQCRIIYGTPCVLRMNEKYSVHVIAII